MRPKDKLKSRVVFVTRNGANTIAHHDEVTAISNAINQYAPKFDALFVAGQEENRKTPLALQLIKPLEIIKQNASNQFNTQTGILSFEQLSHTVLVRSAYIEFQAQGKFQENPAWYKKKNKGGVYDIVAIHGNLIVSCSVHLDSYSNEARFRETHALMSTIEADIVQNRTGYERLTALATTTILFGGDLNYRNRLETNNAENPMQHFTLWGLSEAKKADGITYYGKNMRKKSINNSEAAANQRDPKRLGETMGGKLDRIFFRGPVSLNHEEIIQGTNKTSDHTAVMATFDVTSHSSKEDQFEQSKNYVINLLEGLKNTFSDDDQKKLDKIIGQAKNIDYCDGNNNHYLGQLFEQVLQLRNQTLEAERYRMKALDAEAKIKSWNPFKKLMGYFALPKDNKKLAEVTIQYALATFQDNLKTFQPPTQPVSDLSVSSSVDSSIGSSIDSSVGPSSEASPVSLCSSLSNNHIFFANKRSAEVVKPATKSVRIESDSCSGKSRFGIFHGKETIESSLCGAIVVRCFENETLPISQNFRISIS